MSLEKPSFCEAPVKIEECTLKWLQYQMVPRKSVLVMLWMLLAAFLHDGADKASLCW